MSFEDENFTETLYVDTMDIANAIAAREAALADIMGRITAELNGVEYVPLPEDHVRAANIGRVTLLLARIDDPTRVVTFNEVSDAVRGEFSYKQQAEELSLDDFTVTEEFVKESSHIFSNSLLEHTGTLEKKSAEDFAALLNAARMFAQDHGIRTADVYEDIELYGEVVRKTFTIEDEAQDVEIVLDALSQDAVNNAMLKLFDALPEDVREHLPQDELQEMSIAMQLDTHFQAQIAATVGVLQESLRQYFYYNMVRTWGMIFIDKLSKEQQEKLLPKRPITTVVKELLEEL